MPTLRPKLRKVARTSFSIAMAYRRCGPRFTISLKRSTLIFSYSQAGRPITPSIGGIADLSERLVQTNSVENDPQQT
jgi:hypothetical protein